MRSMGPLIWIELNSAKGCQGRVLETELILINSDEQISKLKDKFKIRKWFSACTDSGYSVFLNRMTTALKVG